MCVRKHSAGDVDDTPLCSYMFLHSLLPGQRNGSQMWHDSFSSFLRDELRITPCDAYPCLLRAENSECVLLLHVDDVLCLVKENYLNTTLVPALRAKYKISLDVVCKEGDELTFLKRKHAMVTPDQLAIQSHPKHLEKLFELLKIKRSLMPKKTPGHPLLDEPDNSKELDAQYAKIYRSCLGILLYISSDYIECQYSIRALSHSMSKPTVHSELFCMLATLMYVFVGMHGKLSYSDLQRSPWTFALHP